MTHVKKMADSLDRTRQSNATRYSRRSNQNPPFTTLVSVLLIAIFVIGTIGMLGCSKKKSEKIDWSKLELHHLLPEPKSKIGKIVRDSDEDLIVDIHKTTVDDFKNYLSQCQAIGYTIESEKSSSIYTAYNEAGYELSLRYLTEDQQLDIKLKAPMKLEKIQWPTSDLAKRLPAPQSSIGKITRESSDRLLVYIGDTPLESYQAYVSACSDKGFNVDYDKGDKYYRANDHEGYHISLRYVGNRVMSIDIEVPDDEPEESATEPVMPTETSIVTDPEPSTSESASSGLIDGMRPEFKEAMDSYEIFFDEYVELMKALDENPADLALLVRYTELLSKLDDVNKKFDAWEDGDMNDTEMNYYIEVHTRVNKKLLEINP